MSAGTVPPPAGNDAIIREFERAVERGAVATEPAPDARICSAHDCWTRDQLVRIVEFGRFTGRVLCGLHAAHLFSREVSR